jgi:hypothetical protein
VYVSAIGTSSHKIGAGARFATRPEGLTEQPDRVMPRRDTTAVPRFFLRGPGHPVASRQTCVSTVLLVSRGGCL